MAGFISSMKKLSGVNNCVYPWLLHKVVLEQTIQFEIEKQARFLLSTIGRLQYLKKFTAAKGYCTKGIEACFKNYP
jgi:hypothetical protein